MTSRIVQIFLLGALISLLVGVSWTAGYEGSPAGTDLASDLDTFIQSLKAEIRQRAEVEHIWGAGGDDNGLHTMGSARCFVQNAAPTDINSGTAALGQYNSAASADAGTALTTDEIGAVTRDIGAGRCWVDLDGSDNTAGTLDDEQLNVWNETSNAWVPVIARDLTGVGMGQNVVYNGSFEITDGTGSSASTTAPAGWSNLNTADIAYTDPTAVTEGEGVALKTTANGGANEGVRQSLANLKASTLYVFRARVRATAGDTCNISVADGTTTVTDTSATTGTFETLEVQLTTTAVPATVNFDLRSTVAGDICEWDHVTAFERGATMASPGIQVCTDQDNDTTATAYTTAGWTDALVSCAVTIPGPGYIVEVRGQLVADNENAGDAALAARLRESGSTVGMSTVNSKADVGGANAFRDLAVVPVFVTRWGLTPGGTYTYTIEGRADGGGATGFSRNMGAEAADLNDSANLMTTLEVRLVPTR